MDGKLPSVQIFVMAAETVRGGRPRQGSSPLAIATHMETSMGATSQETFSDRRWGGTRWQRCIPLPVSTEAWGCLLQGFTLPLPPFVNSAPRRQVEHSAVQSDCLVFL